MNVCVRERIEPLPLKQRLKVKVTQLCPTLCYPMDIPYIPSILQARILEWVGSLSLVQGIFPTQELNPGLPHCGQILYQLSQKGSPTILHWIAYPFSRGYSQPRNQTRVSCIAGRFFTNWAIREVRTSQTIFTDHPLCSGQPGSIRTAAITKCMLPVGQFIPRMTNIYQASTVCISQNNNYHY